jgi:cell division protein FtsW
MIKPHLVNLKKAGNNKPLKPDLVLLGLVLLLTLFGIVMVYNASVVEAYDLFADKYYFLKQQSLWAVLGLAALLLATFAPLNLIKKLSLGALLFNVFLLIIVLIPGIGASAHGARRWINLGGFSLQPTELIKLTLSVYLAAWLSKDRSFWLYLVILGMIVGLIMLQPDLGTTVIIVATGFLVYLASGAKLTYLIASGILGTLSGLAMILSSDYRKQRVMTFLDPSRDPLGSSYHVMQALIAIGSGGLWGLGLGQSRQKYQFLPQVTTDSIFAIIAEETGFLGASLVIILLFLVVNRALKIAKMAPDNFSRLLSVGVACWIGIQAVVNLAAMLSLLPLTGVPLPFISYGGSSLVMTLTGVGLLLNISRFRLASKHYE